MSKVGLLIHGRLKLAVLLIGLGLILATLAIITVIHQSKAEPKPPPGTLTSQSILSSIKPSAKAVANYSVPPTDPKYIAISSLGIGTTPVLRLGLASDNTIATPNNIYETGWYDASSLPGQAGTMFIYGHVSSWMADGIFYNLEKLKPGDQITITRGDNRTYMYQVVASKLYPYDKVNMNEVLAPINASKPGLNLMTCTGQIIKGTSEFDERLVVFTSLVKD